MRSKVHCRTLNAEHWPNEVISTTRRSCFLNLINAVICLDHNRIYGRLGSRKYEPPQFKKYNRANPASLCTELRRICFNQPHNYTAEASAEHARLVAELDDMTATFEDLEQVHEPANIDIIKTLLEQAYRLAIDGRSFLSRLSRCGFEKNSISELRAVGDLMKLANYWRLSDDLTNIARSYHDNFKSLELQTLEHYRPTYSHSRQRFVHAEIQLIAHYEKQENAHLIRPRIIGSSKEACYLCDAFIQAHGTFGVSKAHRQLYEKWTVPDLREYSVEGRARVRRALASVDGGVDRELAIEVRRGGRYMAQSAINLIAPTIRTASVSTIRSIRPPLRTPQPTFGSLRPRSPRQSRAPSSGSLDGSSERTAKMLDNVSKTSVSAALSVSVPPTVTENISKHDGDQHAAGQESSHHNPSATWHVGQLAASDVKRPLVTAQDLNPPDARPAPQDGAPKAPKAEIVNDVPEKPLTNPRKHVTHPANRRYAHGWRSNFAFRRQRSHQPKRRYKIVKIPGYHVSEIVSYRLGKGKDDGFHKHTAPNRPHEARLGMIARLEGALRKLGLCGSGRTRLSLRRRDSVS